MELTKDNCPGVNDDRLASVNAMSDEELALEIEKGAASRFGQKMQPVLKLAQRLREQAAQSSARSEELEIARDANRIAEEALQAAKDANRISKEAKLWSAGAVFISAVTALIIYFTS